MITNFTFGNGTLDGLDILGISNVTEELKDMDMTWDFYRCSFDMKTCDRYPTPQFSDICEKLELKNQFYSNIIEAIEPPFKCPVKVGIYKMKTVYQIPAMFDFVPLDGFVWVTTFKLIDKKSRKLKACLNVETKVVRKRVRN